MDLAYYYELWRGMMLSKDPLVAEAVQTAAQPWGGVVNGYDDAEPGAVHE